MSRELVVLKEALWNGERKSWVRVGGVGEVKAPLTTPVHTLSLHFGATVPRRAEDSVGRCKAEHHSGQAEPGHHQEKHPRWERETEAAGYRCPGRPPWAEYASVASIGLGAGEPGEGTAGALPSPSTRFGGVMDVIPHKHTPSLSGSIYMLPGTPGTLGLCGIFFGLGVREKASNKVKSAPSQLPPVSPPLQSKT